MKNTRKAAAARVAEAGRPCPKVSLPTPAAAPDDLTVGERRMMFGKLVEVVASGFAHDGIRVCGVRVVG
jgi:hypothetical protein